MFSPAARVKVCDRIRMEPTALILGDAGQSGVAAISDVVDLVTVELPFKIALVPKKRLIEDFRFTKAW